MQQKYTYPLPFSKGLTKTPIIIHNIADKNLCSLEKNSRAIHKKSQ